MTIWRPKRSRCNSVRKMNERQHTNQQFTRNPFQESHCTTYCCPRTVPCYIITCVKAILVSGVIYSALWNPAEVDLIVKLCRDLTRILHVESIGIITPYRQQKGEIQSRLMDEWVWFLFLDVCESNKLVDFVILTFAGRETFYSAARRIFIFLTNAQLCGTFVSKMACNILKCHYSVNFFQGFLLPQILLYRFLQISKCRTETLPTGKECSTPCFPFSFVTQL